MAQATEVLLDISITVRVPVSIKSATVEVNTAASPGGALKGAVAVDGDAFRSAVRDFVGKALEDLARRDR